MNLSEVFCGNMVKITNILAWVSLHQKISFMPICTFRTKENYSRLKIASDSKTYHYRKVELIQ